MRRDVAQQLDQLKGKLNGYVALLVYRYANLCIEANPFALLPITVKVDGEEKRLEDVAQVAVHEKYHFNIFPMYEDDFYAIGKGIEESHPEFKQEIKTYEGYEEDDPAGKYIFCTMPEVNKDYHDVLLKAVDTLCDECKGKMDVAKATCMAKLAPMMENISESEVDKLKDYCEEVMKFYSDLRDKNTDDKKKEIEDAYAEYQAKQDEKAAALEQQAREMGNPTQMMMDAAGVE
ncbi:MAG: ribosome recycling factor [Paludibacteraceae bacterium]|nr:ribosome recycling factor [Paludibacteraceae bacterium]